MYTPRDCWHEPYLIYSIGQSIRNPKCKLSPNDYEWLMERYGSYSESAQRIIHAKEQAKIRRQNRLVQKILLEYNLRTKRLLRKKPKVKETLIDRVTKEIERKRSLQSNIG